MLFLSIFSSFPFLSRSGFFVSFSLSFLCTFPAFSYSDVVCVFLVMFYGMYQWICLALCLLVVFRSHHKLEKDQINLKNAETQNKCNMKDFAYMQTFCVILALATCDVRQISCLCAELYSVGLTTVFLRNRRQKKQLEV